MTDGLGSDQQCSNTQILLVNKNESANVSNEIVKIRSSLCVDLNNWINASIGANDNFLTSILPTAFCLLNFFF